MSEFEIKDAAPNHQPIILGLTGPSGSGKTLSALLLAHGIKDVVGGSIGMIDTEGRRGLRYADKARYPQFDYKHMDFQPPFSSERYADAIRAMAATGVKTIIIDSMSHEHEGPGGYLEFHEREIDRLAGDEKDKQSVRDRKSIPAWARPAAGRRRLINSFLQVPLNFIFCFRAKEKLKIVTGQQPIQLGWQAIAGEEFVFEMIVRALLPPGSKGFPDWSSDAFKHGAAKRDAQDAHIFPDNAQITREMGQALAKAYGGTGTATPARQQSSAPADQSPSSAADATVDELKEEGRTVAASGMTALKNWTDDLSPGLRAKIKGYVIDTLQPMARKADAEKMAQA